MIEFEKTLKPNGDGKLRLLGVVTYVLNNGPGSLSKWRDESQKENKSSQFTRSKVLICLKSLG